MNEPDQMTGTLEVFSKPWWKSKAILGGVVAIVSGIATSVFGVDVGSENVGEVVFGLAAAIGGGIAIYGRVKANTVIGK